MSGIAGIDSPSAGEMRRLAAMSKLIVENEMFRKMFADMKAVEMQMAVFGDDPGQRENSRQKARVLDEMWGHLVEASRLVEDAELAVRSARAHE